MAPCFRWLLRNLVQVTLIQKRAKSRGFLIMVADVQFLSSNLVRARLGYTSTVIYIYIYERDIHTYTYIYICICKFLCICMYYRDSIYYASLKGTTFKSARCSSRPSGTTQLRLK